MTNIFRIISLSLYMKLHEVYSFKNRFVGIA